MSVLPITQALLYKTDVTNYIYNYQCVSVRVKGTARVLQ